MVGRKYATFYLLLLRLACILLQIEVYDAGSPTRERDPLPLLRRCTIVSDLHFDFECVLKLQQLLFFHPRTQALCKSSETIDDMKLDSSSDTDSSSENTYSSSEEVHRLEIVEKKISKSKVDVTFKTQPKCLKMTSKH